MTLSIAIVNWNAGKYLLDCLASIYSNPPDCTFEVILADNASTDGSAADAVTCFPNVHGILNTENLGFARANNQIIHKCSTSDYILLLNPDTVVKPGAIQALVDFLDENLAAGACGPILNWPDGSAQLSCSPFPNVRRELWRLLHLDALYPYALYPISRWHRGEPHQVDSIQGACLLIRRNALDQVGELDSEYFMYSEEVDLCYRLKRAGWDLFWVPTAKVIHYGGISTKQVPLSMFLNLYRSKVRFFRKSYGKFHAWMYKCVLFLTSILRLIISPLAFFENRHRREYHNQLTKQYSELLKALPGY